MRHGWHSGKKLLLFTQNPHFLTYQILNLILQKLMHHLLTGLQLQIVILMPHIVTTYQA